ncbi:sodium:solute symporter family protein [Pyrolobus fumarii]|uniref:sodium:solute symporter family protein n=1 Tax=Pyrolobus fumarii TaxID=54252 RepID=UPI001FCC4EC2|nr:sodium:solute symporter family protein [Pyrolobus fumarii]
MALWFAGLFVLFVAVGSLIAWLSRRMGIRTVEDFYTAGGRLGGFLAALTYAATTYSSFMMVGLVGFAYSTGVGSLGFELAYLIATLGLLSLVGPRIWRMARERGWVSPSEVLSGVYGSRTLGVAVALLYLVALVPYASAQFIGVGRVFEGLGLGFAYGVAAMFILSALWTLIAGMWSVATTDAFQGTWMIATAIALIAWLSTLIAGHDVDVARLVSEKGLLDLTSFWTPSTFLAFTIPWVFFAVTNPQVVQRLYVPRDAKSYRRMVTLFGLYGWAYTLLVVGIGLIAAGLSAANILPPVDARDKVTPTLLTLAPAPLAAATYVGIVAASISTVDSIVLSIASALSHELGLRGLKAAYIAVLLINTAAAAVALSRPAPIVEMSVLSSLLLLPLAVPTIIAALSPQSARGMGGYALASIVSGVAIAFAAALILGPKKAFIFNIWGVPLSLIVLIVSTVLVLPVLLRHRG